MNQWMRLAKINQIKFIDDHSATCLNIKANHL